MKHVIIILITSLLFGIQTTGCAANPKIQSVSNAQLDSIITARVDSILPAKLDSMVQGMQVANDIKNVEIRVSELESSRIIIYIFLFTSLVFIALLIFNASRRNLQMGLVKHEASTEETRGSNVVRTSLPKESTQAKKNATKTEVKKVRVEDKVEQNEKNISKSIVIDPVKKTDVQHLTQSKDVKATVKTKTVKYGTFELLENGELRTSDRRLTDDASLQWFKIMYFEDSDIATYTVNPSKKQEIISDVQTFQYYVEPFAVVGIPNDIKIEKEGKLRRNGKYWTVTEKLKVNLI